MRQLIRHISGASRFTEQTRFRGHRGGIISMHRALNRFHLGSINLVASICLFVLFSSIWIFLLPQVCHVWSQLFAWSLYRLPLHATLEVTRYNTQLVSLEIPYLRMEPMLPSLLTWSVACAVTLLLFAGTYLGSKNLAPLIYLLRGILLVQATALIYFAAWPARFPHTPDSYLEGLVTASLGVITIVPLLFSLTYYIFDFGLLKKAFLTAVTMAHLVLFVPCQILLHALVLQKTVLFMPLLYIIFGLPVDILLIVAFYSWGMTWSFRPAQIANRPQRTYYPVA